MNDRAPSSVPAPVVLTAPLSGRRIIEASAGTGKTWTIAGLVARFVVEQGLEIGRILVVTFTEAATAELRARVRAKLVALRDALDGRDGLDDPFPAAWIAWAAPDARARERARLRIDAALRGFDEAAIFTIHGFCQRALAEHAFTGARGFELDLTDERDALLHQAVADAWRQRVVHHDPADAHVVAPADHAIFVQRVLDTESTPASMARWIGAHLSRHRVSLVGGAPPHGWSAAVHAVAAAWQPVHRGWPQGRAAVERAVRSGALPRTSYRETWLAGWVRILDAACSRAVMRTLDRKTREVLDRFRASRLAQAASIDAPSDPWFDAVETLLSALDRFDAEDAKLLAWFRRTMFDAVRTRLAREMAARRERTYDDLLVDLDAAIAASHGAVAHRLATRYPAMLIDEFQDTDPLQAAIFDRIHAAAPEASTLYFVGDPKQAIYGFRGADLHTYLHGRASAMSAGTLDENQRSSPALLRALDALFARRTPPFGLDRIAFRRAQPSPRARSVLTDRGQPADAFVWLDVRPSRPFRGQGAAIAAALDATADRIVAMLNARDLRLGDAPVQPGDIAVLVGDRHQTMRMKHALARRGVGSATRLRASVYASHEAHDLLVLLTALTPPYRTTALRAALLLDLFGLDAHDLHALDHDDAQWQRWRERFARHADQWRAHGVAPMLRRVLFEYGGYARIAASDDGERRLTNLAHLAQLLQHEVRRRQSTDAVRERLGHAIARARDGAPVGEEAELRLDSDANLVQIRTIHTSKGLEYPIVFVPTLWALGGRGAGASGEPAFYHDDEDRALLDFDAGPDARERQAREAFQERLRLAYVALTRARARCVVAVGALPGVERSPLGWWLLDAPEHDAAVAGASKKRPDPTAVFEAQRAQLDAALAAHGARVDPVDPDRHGPRMEVARFAAPEVRVEGAAHATRATLAVRRTASFSALVERAAETRADAPDHDQRAPASDDDRSAAPDVDDARFLFARGADAGDTLHRLFEAIDWSAPRAQWAAPIDQALRRAGLALDEAAMARWLDAIARTPLRGACALADVRLDRTLRELEFELPLERVDFARVAALAVAHGWPMPEVAPSAWHGVLRGFIDLVFVHDNALHVVDYKSNWLGAHIDAYDDRALARALDDGGYRLQSLLYLVAVRRWARAARRDRLRLGAAHVLFVRGMNGRDAHGTVTLDAPVALIDAVDAALGGALR